VKQISRITSNKHKELARPVTTVTKDMVIPSTKLPPFITPINKPLYTVNP
jgi:hypothetical protein